MIGQPAGRQRLGPVKAETAEIELSDKNIDHPNRVVVTDPVVQALRKQCALACTRTAYSGLGSKPMK